MLETGAGGTMRTMSTAPKLATYEDLLGLPDNVLGQIVNGTLYAHPRPSISHSRAATVLSHTLGPRFGRGPDVPSGWIFLYEPELHLGRHVLVPDLAGWRRERMPELPEGAYLTVSPDWVCEVLSPSTEAFDRNEKLPVYARQGVAFAWLVSPEARSLEVFRLEGALFRAIASHAAEAQVRAEPFEELELELQLLWQR